MPIEGDGLERVRAKVDDLAGLDAQDLRELEDALQRAMVEDNRRGVLRGTDRYDQPAPPLAYRGGGGFAASARWRTSSTFGTASRRFKGQTSYQFTNRAGQAVILPNNNLASRVYRTMDGPRLAPRREASRAIANYRPLPSELRSDGLVVQCGWVDVVSAKGRPFLAAHFEGRGNLPRYDLRGVRAWGRERAREILRDWIKALIGA